MFRFFSYGFGVFQKLSFISCECIIHNYGEQSHCARGGEVFEALAARPVRRRNRTKVGRRSNKAKYKQALAYVRKDVRERVERARNDPEVRVALEAELRDRGVEHKPGDPEYSALVELLLVDWLDSMGWGMGE